MNDLKLLQNSKTLLQALGIEFTTLEKEKLLATMPVDERTFQIEGILHGGASAALIETLASVGSYLNINPETHYAVGTELNVSHISSAHRGKVTGEARPIKIGRNIHFWNVEIKQDEKLVSTGRCSLFIQERKK